MVSNSNTKFLYISFKLSFFIVTDYAIELVMMDTELL